MAVALAVGVAVGVGAGVNVGVDVGVGETQASTTRASSIVPLVRTTAAARAMAVESAPTATVLYPAPAPSLRGGILTFASSSPSPTAVAK